MTKLATLRERIHAFRRRRQRVRWGVGIAGGVCAVLWTAATMFVIDFTLQMSRAQRVVLLAMGLAVVMWAFRRFVSPWLKETQSEVDVALMIEREQEIDSDLVAALQFESGAASSWGSPQLRGAVIDYVAEFASGWKLPENFRTPQLVRRTTTAGITLAVVLLAAMIWPGYLAAFVSRMFLSSAHYPTRTVMRLVLINGQPVDLAAGSVVRLPYGSPLRFEVHATGELPPDGSVSIHTAGGGAESTVKLARTPRTDDAVYTAKLPDVVDSLVYELSLGDAWTDPARVAVIPAPVVETRFDVHTPAYARAARGPLPDRGLREVWAMEGSRVDLRLTCRNKPLKSATLTVDKKQISLHPVTAGEQPGRIWTLNPAGTPLASLTRAVQYEVDVTDADGMHLPAPIRGSLRIRADRKPRVLASTMAKLILPTARPPIDYRVWDDYGVRNLHVRVEVTHADGKADHPAALPVSATKMPILAGSLPLSSTVSLDLAPLHLAKGDQLKLWVEVEDYRGDTKGQLASSDPLVLHVTDEAGILADISEPDRKSAGQLDAIIRQQLGIGSSR